MTKKVIRNFSLKKSNYLGNCEKNFNFSGKIWNFFDRDSRLPNISKRIDAAEFSLHSSSSLLFNEFISIYLSGHAWSRKCSWSKCSFDSFHLLPATLTLSLSSWFSLWRQLALNSKFKLAYLKLLIHLRIIISRTHLLDIDMTWFWHLIRKLYVLYKKLQHNRSL